MTRKDFDLIARAIRETQGREALVDRLCEDLKGTNPQFNPKRFRDAAYGASWTEVPCGCCAHNPSMKGGTA